jgi:hypothetical protein
MARRQLEAKGHEVSIYQPRIAKERTRGAPLRERRRIAEEVRRACLEVALGCYEAALGAGQSKEAAWSRAMEGVRAIDIAQLVRDLAPDAGRGSADGHAGHPDESAKPGNVNPAV